MQDKSSKPKILILHLLKGCWSWQFKQLQNTAPQTAALDFKDYEFELELSAIFKWLHFFCRERQQQLRSPNLALKLKQSKKKVRRMHQTTMTLKMLLVKKLANQYPSPLPLPLMSVQNPNLQLRGCMSTSGPQMGQESSTCCDIRFVSFWKLKTWRKNIQVSLNYKFNSRDRPNVGYRKLMI